MSCAAASPLWIDERFDGEFCYILTSRQVGKSSLMFRTALRLRAQGVRSVILDLNAVGTSSERESWYYTLLIKVGQAVSLRAELRACWQSEPELDCVHRWIEGRRTILRQRNDLRLAIFVDEVDSTTKPAQAGSLKSGSSRSSCPNLSLD